MKLINKTRNVLMMIGYEIEEGLYRGILKVLRKSKASSVKDVTFEIWHRRLGHCSREILKSSLSKVAGVSIDEFRPVLQCESCALGKSKRQARKLVPVELKAKNALDQIHSDVVGPIAQTSYDRSKYFVTVMDEFSGYSLMRFIAQKSEAGMAVKDMIRQLEVLLTPKSYD